MKEASKTLSTFSQLQRFQIFGGTGIDIGCGNDLVAPNFVPFDKEQGDANRILQVVKTKYHCVASFHCLQHLINPYKSIQDMWELVEEGGYLVIAVPDQDLYEQGIFPSRFNGDHKWTFTIQKKCSWSPKSINVKDLLKLLAGYSVIKLQVQDKGYNYSLKDVDQTCHSDAMSQILLVLKKEFRMKVALVTYYNDACLPFAQLSDISKMKYAAKWKYSYFLHTKAFTDRQPHWNKFPALLEHFHSAEYVVWIDADAFIVNHNFDIGSLFGDKDIYMSKDCHGWNNGVFALRTSNISRSFLQDCIGAYAQFRHAGFKEQSCMGYFMDTKYKDFVQQVPVRAWNSYDDVYSCVIDNKYTEGDFILHLPNQGALNGIRPNYRVVRFGELLKELI